MAQGAKGAIGYGLDFTAVLEVAKARGADLALVAELLPRVEPAMLAPYRPEAGDDAEDDETLSGEGEP